MIPFVELPDEPEPVVATDGRIYSTKPTTTRATNGKDYYLKGPGLEVVVAEALGYRLAAAVGIPVPDCALCRHPDSGALLFASAALPIRGGVEAIASRHRIDNPELFAECLAFDVWTANTDRNDGNFVADPIHRPRPANSRARQIVDVRLIAIDFESAKILRGVDRFTVTAIPDKQLRPGEAIARRCFNCSFPDPTCRAIASVTRQSLEAIMTEVAESIAPDEYKWAESAASQLEQRGASIRRLAEGVWNA